jgi:hypothetical protein
MSQIKFTFRYARFVASSLTAVAFGFRTSPGGAIPN